MGERKVFLPLDASPTYLAYDNYHFWWEREMLSYRSNDKNEMGTRIWNFALFGAAEGEKPAKNHRNLFVWTASKK